VVRLVGALMAGAARDGQFNEEIPSFLLMFLSIEPTIIYFMTVKRVGSKRYSSPAKKMRVSCDC
jgi:hypothetical protein